MSCTLCRICSSLSSSHIRNSASPRSSPTVPTCAGNAVDGDPAAAGPVGLTGYAAATLFWKELRRSLPLPCLSFSFRPATVKLSRPWFFQRWLLFVSLTRSHSARRIAMKSASRRMALFEAG